MVKLLIEDGSIHEYANSYISIDDVDESSQYMIGFDKWNGYYNDKHDINIPALSEEEKTKTLISAGMLLNSPKYEGVKVNEFQGMEFPRDFTSCSCLDPKILCCSRMVPDILKKAQLLLVRDILMGDIDPTGRKYSPKVQSLYFQQGGSITFSGATNLSQGDESGFTAINPDPLYSVRRLINPFIIKTKSSVMLIRL